MIFNFRETAKSHSLTCVKHKLENMTSVLAVYISQKLNYYKNILLQNLKSTASENQLGLSGNSLFEIILKSTY